MTIELSHHAMEKARMRGVSMTQIYQTLRTPDELYNDVEHVTMIALKKINDKSIVLAYREEAGAVKVITIYYTTKINRLIASKTVRGAWKKAK
jgi:hypothetical protein